MRSCNTDNGRSFRVTALAVGEMFKLKTLYYEDDLTPLSRVERTRKRLY